MDFHTFIRSSRQLTNSCAVFARCRGRAVFPYRPLFSACLSHGVSYRQAAESTCPTILPTNSQLALVPTPKILRFLVVSQEGSILSFLRIMSEGIEDKGVRQEMRAGAIWRSTKIARRESRSLRQHTSAPVRSYGCVNNAPSSFPLLHFLLLSQLVREGSRVREVLRVDQSGH